MNAVSSGRISRLLAKVCCAKFLREVYEAHQRVNMPTTWLLGVVTNRLALGCFDFGCSQGVAAKSFSKRSGQNRVS